MTTLAPRPSTTQTRTNVARGPASTRLAIVLPEDAHAWDCGRGLRLAEALVQGAEATGDRVEIIVATVGSPTQPIPDALQRLPAGVRHRHVRWQVLDAGESRRALAYAGLPKQDAGVHLVPDDGIRTLLDCDAWIIAAAGLSAPVLPLRPTVLVVDDWMHHAVRGPGDVDAACLVKAIGQSAAVIVFSEWMRDEAIHFLGAEPGRVLQSAVAIPVVSPAQRRQAADEPQHFVWCIDGRHPGDLEPAIRCLEHYGSTSTPMTCRIVPLCSSAGGEPMLPEVVRQLADHPARGSLIDCAPRAATTVDQLATELLDAAFVWHPERAIDSRCLPAEAHRLEVPCLAAEAPATRGLTRAAGIELAWADVHDPAGMARALRAMPEWQGPASRADGAAALADTSDSLWTALAVHL